MTTHMITRPPALKSQAIVLFSCLSLIALMTSPASAKPATRPTLPFDTSSLRLLDEVDLGIPEPGHHFRVFPDANVVERKTILGKPCLLLPDRPDAPDRYVAVRLGEGKGLKDGVPYVLQIDYPEDLSRSMIVWNTGNETARAFHTGNSLGDALKMPYVYGNPESLNYPLSGQWQLWTSVFELHQRYPDLTRSDDRSLTPADGFTVVLAHYRHANDPTSQGLAAGRVRLYAAPELKAMELSLKRPPAGLPQRHLFWREEMSDGIIFDKKNPAFDPPRIADWFSAKMRLMKFIGMDTYAKDLLEFGHNQGWDSAKFGSNDWVYQSSHPQLWSQIVELAGKYQVNVLPMYEYCGSMGGAKALGPRRRCKTLNQAGKGPKGRDDYTHITWSENGNADVTDPDTVEDLRKMLEITIADEKNKATILGAWLRPRNSGMPVSFSDRCLKLFAEQTGRAQAPTRGLLKTDKALYKDYLNWWHLKRHDFLVSCRNYLAQPTVLGPDATVLFTGDPSEPGSILEGGGIVTDTPTRFPGEKTVLPETVFSERLGWAALTGEHGTWGGWEWQHSVPSLDPQNYTGTPGVMLTMAFSRQYSVSDPKILKSFHTQDGLAMIRHYPLNENCFGDKATQPLGYFVADFEEAGPYCVLAEARALALGDPRFIGYLTANSLQRGFPEYVRAFNEAFLALPALPGSVVENATSAKEVVVRQIPTPKNGIWYAVVNTGMTDANDVRITLKQNTLTNVLTGNPVTLQKQTATVSLYPGQVLVWKAAP